MTVKYRIYLMESERGWGQEYWHEDYDTLEEAYNRIKTVNARNTSPTAPDWYMQAEERINVVETQMENDIEQLKEYIQNLERWLENAGQRKICSHCTLACFPIWGKDKSECCEVCDE